MKQRLKVYVHKDTGDVQVITSKQAKKLPPEYGKAEFTKNEKGERVMRLKLANATVDISENEAPTNGNTTAE